MEKTLRIFWEDSGKGFLPCRNSIMRISLELLCVKVSFSLALLRVRPHTGTGILWHTVVLFLP